MRAERADIRVRAVDGKRRIGRIFVEAVAGLQIHDTVLLQAVHQRRHRIGRRLSIVIIQVHVDVETIHPSVACRRPQRGVPECRISAVAETRIVDTQDEARHALEDEAILGVERDVHREPRTARSLRHAIGGVRRHHGVRREVDKRDGRKIATARLHRRSIERRNQVRRGGKGLLRNDLPARLVGEYASDTMTAEVATRRCHGHVELNRLRLIVEEHSTVVGIQQKYVDRRRHNLHEVDIVKPRRSGCPIVVFQPYRRGPVGVDHDRADLIQLPVVRPADDVGRPPGVDAARAKVERQPDTAR